MHSYDQIERLVRAAAADFRVVFDTLSSKVFWPRKEVCLAARDLHKEGMFTVYHELAHVLLEHNGCFPFSTQYERQENEANYVALGTVLRLRQFDHPLHESWNLSPTMFDFGEIEPGRFSKLDRAVSKIVNTYILTIGQPQGTTKVQCQESAQQSCLPPMQYFGSSFSSIEKAPAGEGYLFSYLKPSASFFLPGLVTSVDK